MVADRIQGKIGDFFDLVTGYAFKSSEFVGFGVPVIKIKNVKAGQMVYDELSYVSDHFLRSRPDKTIKRGDLLITMSGNRLNGTKETWVGKVAQFNRQGNYFLNQRVGILRPKSGVELERQYFNYALSSDFYQNEFIAIATSSGGQANLSPAQILGAPIVVPPIEEQRAVAVMLGTLDDKIELNRRMNATLEAMARALFQSWFVDFDPVHAKAAGRLPVGMDEATAALFPESFQDSELRDVPSGWETSTIGKEARVVGGSTPSTKNPEFWDDGDFHWVTPKDFSSLQSKVLITSSRMITGSGLRQISSGLLPKSTVLLSSRAPVGYLALTQIPTAINQGFIAMICDGRLPPEYVLHWADSIMDRIKQAASGTTFAEISKATFRPFSILVPPMQILDTFISVVRPLTQQVTANERESVTLAEIRNSLLPKLLAGDLSVEGVY
jgi:type I restriction enzyme S subunit